MSELVLTNQASPGALGAGLSAFFFSVSGLPSYVGNDGIVYSLTGVDGNGSFAYNGNFSAGGNVSWNGRAQPAYVNTGTVGNVTINAAAGRFTAAANATQVVVTNSYVTANSQVLCTAAANDATGRVIGAVPSAGAFTAHVIAPTANMPINFFVLN